MGGDDRMGAYAVRSKYLPTILSGNSERGDAHDEDEGHAA